MCTLTSSLERSFFVVIGNPLGLMMSMLRLVVIAANTELTLDDRAHIHHPCSFRTLISRRFGIRM